MELMGPPRRRGPSSDPPAAARRKNQGLHAWRRTELRGLPPPRAHLEETRSRRRETILPVSGEASKPKSVVMKRLMASCLETSNHQTKRN